MLARVSDGARAFNAQIQTLTCEIELLRAATFVLPAEAPGIRRRMRIWHAGRGAADGPATRPSARPSRSRTGGDRSGTARWAFGLGVGPTPVRAHVDGRRRAILPRGCGSAPARVLEPARADVIRATRHRRRPRDRGHAACRSRKSRAACRSRSCRCRRARPSTPPSPTVAVMRRPKSAIPGDHVASSCSRRRGRARTSLPIVGCARHRHSSPA